MRIPIIAAACAAALCLAACAGSDTRSAGAGPASAPAPVYGNVDSKRLLAADQNAGQWMSTGRTYSEQRFSPLKQINTGNVAQLGLAWYGDFEERSRRHGSDATAAQRSRAPATDTKSPDQKAAPAASH